MEKRITLLQTVATAGVFSTISVVEIQLLLLLLILEGGLQNRFLHPDIVADYNYIFLWDEDLLVDNFNPKRYLSIVKEEGLEISQPALDRDKSEIHHPLTAHIAGSKVHRRYYKLKGSGRCDDSSTTPPCLGWVEMMAPVFSKKSWQCVWHMIQAMPSPTTGSFMML
ncbi:uncharacterized protein [Cicer arietinum]|uniref:uncharacterized protein n=1 Tax=Cicer arietinum TaxID=3827 RepID=UPI000641703B